MPIPAASVCLDVQGLQSEVNLKRGIGRYMIEQLRALAGLAPEVVHSIRVNPLLREPPALDFLQEVAPIVADPLGDPVLAERPPLIYHAMAPFQMEPTLEELWPAWVRRGGARTVVTLYDLIPQLFGEFYLSDRFWRGVYNVRCLSLLRGADQLLALSRATAADAERHLGVPAPRITVIDAGVTGALTAEFGSVKEARRHLEHALPRLRPGFLLYVGGDDHRKNLPRLLAAYSSLSPNQRAAHQLVLAGRFWEPATLDRAAADCGLREDELLIPGYVDDRTLAALYRCCRLFVFPSLYEGSGLPVLEAMACGAPVVAGAVSALPEVLGDAEGTFDPTRVEDMATTISAALDDEAELARLRQRSLRRANAFSWDHVAERTLVGYERALRGPARVRRLDGRRRIAIVTCWPPEPTATAIYCRRLLQSLSYRARIEVALRDWHQDYDLYSLLGRVSFYSPSRWDAARRLFAYDHIVYCFGGTELDAHVLQAARERPGSLVLLGPPPGDPHLLAQAERILVHSHQAERTIRSLLRGGPVPPIRQLPFGIVDDRSRRLSVDTAEGPRLLALGEGRPGYGLEPVLGALRRIAERHPGVSLVIAAHELDSNGTRAWRERAAGAGVADRVEFRGQLTADLYWRLLGAADLALQLRPHATGEVSLSTADCIAARLPTVSTAGGWADELPEGVVERVPQRCDASAVAGAALSLLDDRRREAARECQDQFARENDFGKAVGAWSQELGL